MNQQHAIFHFKLANGELLKLRYKLAPTSLRDRWINIVNRRRNTKDKLELKISNKTTKDLEDLMRTINEIIEKINEYYDKKLPIFKNVSEMGGETLNHLHEEFELYGERHQQAFPVKVGEVRNNSIWPGSYFREDFHNAWLKLNEYIHIIETAAMPSHFPNFSCLVQYEPFERGDLLNPEDKLFLDTDFSWGQLYLGYNTLGKDWKDAAADNDLRLIANNQVKVQESFCSESWLNFSDHVSFHRREEMKFWDWYKNLSSDLKSKIPIDDMSQLALGRYYLGMIMFDEAFLKFHPRVEDWLVPYSELRRRWNLEVFSQIIEAVDIEII
jgi:hypothetical protein